MSNWIANISDKIKSELNAISNFNGVYEHEPDIPTDGKYPFATITFAGREAEFGDTQQNLVIYKFLIRVYVERTGAAMGNSKSERVMREICDAVTNSFDNNTTLDGLVKFVKPIPIDMRFDDREVGDVRVADITIEAVVLESSTN